MRPLRVATRASALARWQAAWVAQRLAVPTELVTVTTAGDRDAATPIHEMGGTGVFATEVEAAVLDGRADLAVHSAKDLPAGAAPGQPDTAGLVLAAFPERADPRDVLVGSTLDALAPGATVGTGAVRRRAQLAALRPDLRFAELRGNVDTRLDKAAAFDAVALAKAGLDRLGRADRITEVLDPAVVVPQVGQGALAVQCRREDARTRALVAALDHAATRRHLLAERAFLATLGGGCTLPCGAHARTPASDLHAVTLDVFLGTVDGATALRAHGSSDDAEALGVRLAHQILDAGGRELLTSPSSASSGGATPGGTT
jgi:hydroxymethylbilane synthase